MTLQYQSLELKARQKQEKILRVDYSCETISRCSKNLGVRAKCVPKYRRQRHIPCLVLTHAMTQPRLGLDSFLLNTTTLCLTASLYLAWPAYVQRHWE